MLNSRMSPRNSYSSDSDDEEEWSSLQRKSRKKKHSHSAKKAKIDATAMHLEEGEISSDDLDDDEDDGLDENLIGGEEDKRKLEKMSEKEREEELFKRAERRDAIQARRAVKQKLKEKRDRERAEKASKLAPFDSAKQKKQSAYANVFSSDSEEVLNSDSSGAAGPQGLRQRKIALEKRKEAHSHKFHELIERRRQQAAKKRRIQSGSEEDRGSNARNSAARSSAASSLSTSDLEESRSKKGTDESRPKHSTSMSQRIYSDASDASTDSSRPGARPQVRRPSLSSLSGSQRSGSSSEDDARGRSRSPEEELVSSLDQLSRIRLSRFKIEKWVHMPFFDDLIKGCFVRINIGLNQGVPVYRCAEVVDVLETPKIYDLGDTRTNKGVVVRVGKDQSTFRLAFVSNSEFLPSEFESWMRRITDANMKPPTLTFVNRKAAEIQDAINHPIKDERLVEQIIQSKKRFQRAPTNFALRKAELIKQREQAEAEGDTELLQRIDMELEEVESQAERIDRRRTLGFKSITSINQRNRVLSLQQAEEAIRKESEEAQKSKEEDPFTRVHSQPVIVTKKYLEQLRHKRTGNVNQDDTQNCVNNSITDGALSESVSASALLTPNTSRQQGLSTNSSSLGLDRSLLNDSSDRVRWSLANETLNLSTPHDSLHAIHNFEININLDLDGTGGDQRYLGVGDRNTPSKSKDLDSSVRSPHLPDSVGARDSPNCLSASGTLNGSGAKPNRRLLNLQEYKKRLGLI
ncbi:RNA polymerase-associated protein RTF1 [Paragonimus heterotremus]|uniref:RNA polymerase-associated protein RTF1 n=1 Tax=Paragonimus heterotremus TaxID=100268 RepID=A0A8J4WGJ2_9TREM|nr:RNA polymerase-associated protein RTF1 [Paragonimus heterotremus]